MSNDDSGRMTAVIIVDHGSRLDASNQMLLAVVDQFREHSDYEIVEPAHMELAEPSIRAAFDRCVDQGATFVVVFPFFLLPGRHWTEDIPRLVAAAAEPHPDVGSLVTAPIGTHPTVAEIIQSRIDSCLARAAGDTESCDVCRDLTTTCPLRGGISGDPKTA